MGRNERENNLIRHNKGSTDYFFEVPDVVGPTVILQGDKSKDSVQFAASLTLAYSDFPTGMVDVALHDGTARTILNVEKADVTGAGRYNLSCNI